MSNEIDIKDATEEASDTASPDKESDTEAPILERREQSEGAQFKRSIYALPVTVQVVIGRARPTIAELLKLTDGSVMVIDKAIDAPVDLCVDDRIIARGELIETNEETGEIGLKIIEIVDVSEDLLV